MPVSKPHATMKNAKRAEMSKIKRDWISWLRRIQEILWREILMALAMVASLLIPWVLVLAGRWMTHAAWVRHTQGACCLAPRMPMQSRASVRYRRVY